MSAIIRTENLSYLYSQGTPFEKAAVDNVSLEIEQGAFVGVIGHTGSGKSTLIQHFNGLLKPSSGKIFVDGEDIWQNPKDIRRFRFKVGLVFQYPEYQLFEETVIKDISFGPSNMGLETAEISRRANLAAKAVGLRSDVLDKSPFELSGGQKRRAAIAGVMAMRPDVLILDEPTAGLDPHGRDMILKEIKHYHDITHGTILLVSHSMEEIARYADKVLVMNNAKVFAYGTVAEVFSRSSELAGIGLDIPQIAKICSMLREKGFDIDPRTYTIEDAKRQILALIKG
jgi:energy-coupling factor transport system ATP-binding protein